MTTERFQIQIIDVDGNLIDTDDTLFTADQLDSEMTFWGAERVRLGTPRFDAYAVDMADGSRGYIRVVGAAD